MKKVNLSVQVEVSELSTDEDILEGVIKTLKRFGFNGVVVELLPSPRLYRVKVSPSTTLNPDCMKDGYLSFCGVIQEYGLCEARRKAHVFNGEVERV